MSGWQTHYVDCQSKGSCSSDVLFSWLYRHRRKDQQRVRTQQKHSELLEVGGIETIKNGMGEN